MASTQFTHAGLLIHKMIYTHLIRQPWSNFECQVAAKFSKYLFFISVFIFRQANNKLFMDIE